LDTIFVKEERLTDEWRTVSGRIKCVWDAYEMRMRCVWMT